MLNDTPTAERSGAHRAFRFDSRAAIGGIMLIAALLGFIALGRRSYWLDESVSVMIARLDWSSFVQTIHTSEGNMSLYHLILFGWSRLAGDSELAVRSLSVLAGVASVGILYLLAKRLGNAYAALLASLLLAVNPLFVRYAQEARGYELSLLLVTLASYLFVRGLERPSWKIWIAYALVVGLSGYAHVFALLVPVGHASSLVFRERRELPWRQLVCSAGIVVLSVGPLAFLLSSSSQSSAVGWVGGNNALGRVFLRIHDRPPVAVAVLTLGITTLALGYWLLTRRFGPRLHTPAAWRWGFVLSWLLVPPLIVAVVAIIYEPLFLARYFIICLPAAVLLLASIVERIPSRRLATAALVALVLISLAPVIRWYQSGEAENWRGATASVVAAARPGDGIVFVATFARVPFALYINQEALGDRAPTPIDPAGDWGTRTSVYGKSLPISVSGFERGASDHPRIWVVLSHGSTDDYEAALTALKRAGYRQRQLETFTGLQTVLLTHR